MPNGTNDYDCIVVGGGPAGVSCALTLAKLGKTVAILDKKSHDQIGNKTCGDALDRASPSLLKDELNIDLPHGNEVSDNVSKMTIATPSTKITLSAPGYTVDRHIYGQRLLKDCENSGVTVLDNAPVRDLIIEDGFVKGVKYYNGGDIKDLRAKLIADCSGTIGAVRNKLPENFSEGLHQKIPDYHIAATFREIVTMREEHEFPEEILLSYAPSIPPPGYIWFFTKGKKRLNIGTGWLKSENKNFKMSMKEIYRAALNEWYEKDKDYTVDVTGGGQIPIRPPFDSMTFNGGLIIGDAACQVDPTTAEGHGPALVCGFYAGRAMVEALDKSDLSREGLWKYNKDVMDHYGRRNAISYVTLQFLRDIGPQGMDFILKRNVLTERDIKDVFAGENPDMTLLSVLGRIIKCFPKWGILIKLNQLVKNVKRMGNIYENYPMNPKDLTNWRKERDLLLGESL